MNSLYWRIFLAFWVALALILIGTVTVAVNGELQRRFSQPWVKRAELYAQATQAFEAGGPVGLRKWLTALRPKELLANTFVVGGDGLELLGRSVPDYLRDPPGQFAIASSTTLLPPPCAPRPGRWCSWELAARLSMSSWAPCGPVRTCSARSRCPWCPPRRCSSP